MDQSLIRDPHLTEESNGNTGSKLRFNDDNGFREGIVSIYERLIWGELFGEG